MKAGEGTLLGRRPSRRARPAGAKKLVGWEPFYRVVRKIPRGRVMTYGAVADAARKPRCARHVGYAMAALHGTAHDVPWHRVVGARPRKRAGISMKDPTGAALQRLRLEAEGVEFDEREQIDLARYGWGRSL